MKKKSHKHTTPNPSSTCEGVFFRVFFIFPKKITPSPLLIALVLSFSTNLFAIKATTSAINDTNIFSKAFKSGELKRNNQIRSEGEIVFQNSYGNILAQQDFRKFKIIISNKISTKDYINAQKLLDIAKQFDNLSEENVNYLHYLQGRIYYRINNYELSRKEFLLTTKSERTETNQILLNRSHFYLGLMNYKNNLYTDAINNYKESLKHIKLDAKYSYDVHLKIAFCYFNLNNPEMGINYLDSGIVFLGQYPDKQIGHLLHAKILQRRAYEYRQKANHNRDSIELLRKSILDCETSINYINKYVSIQNFESDQLIFNNKYNYFFYKTIEANTRLYNTSKEDSLLYHALHYAELDKNLSLLRNIQKQKAREKHELPLSKTDYIDAFSYELVKIEEEIYNLKYDNSTPDSLLLSYYQLKGQLIDEIDSKEKDLEVAYPNYYADKYLLPKMDVDYINKLSHSKQIIEYVISDEKIYMFLINDGKIHFHDEPYTKEHASKIERFRQLTADMNHISFSDSEFQEFQNTSNELYNLLIQPFANKLNDKPLLFIPDNELNLIPFEALISSKSEQKISDYSALNYLINDYDISYAHSVELLKHQSSKSNFKQAKREVLSYAPTYLNLAGNEGPQYLAMRDARDNLGKLPGALSEVNYIKKLLNSTRRIENSASESNFKDEAQSFSVIHCAMHALVDNNNPLFSKLIFTPDADTEEDGLLNTYEVSNLKLQADLVVLSACNTAYGNINKGEGLQSISRGFIKAGCQSIMSTLWSVSDKTSSTLIKTFYDGLSKGQNKSESLSQAKRNFLKQNSGVEAHPFYWAGYILSGNDSPINIKQSNSKYWYLLFLLLLPISIIIFRKNRLF